MPWVLIPLAALALAGWKVWINYRKERSTSDSALLVRIERNEAALEAARRRIANLEAIVVDNLEERPKPTALVAESDADRVAMRASSMLSAL